MNTIWQTLTHTPWWVYLLLAYLLRMGIKASQTRIVALKKLFIIPIIFSAMSVHTVLDSFQLTGLAVGILASNLLLGIMIGWYQVYRLAIQVDRQHGLIQIPGTWSTLIIILIIFATKYYFGYELAMDPQLTEDLGFEFAMLGVSGVCTGLFIGKLISYLIKYFHLPQTDLKGS